jgi:MSHA biogenesis protein MshL
LLYAPDGQSSEAANNAQAAAPAGTSATSQARSNGGFVINRQAGVLAVNGTQRQHEMVANFLSLMTRNASAQVLIEAKIVEVALTDQFASGVDWNRVIGDVNDSYLGLGSYIPGVIPSASASGLRGTALTFGINQPDLGAVVALTQRFGTTRTLSSPRLSAINNQQAVLTFARNQVYFDCDYTPGSTTGVAGSSTGSTATAPALDCEQRTVPIGIIMSILPSVNLDTQEVTLNVRPTLTRLIDSEISPVTGFLRSQAVDATAAASIPDIATPVIESREIDSITKVKSGGVMVIGGLMEDITRNENNSMPGVGEIPLFGNLFKGREEDSSKRELIIFIKATIVNSDGSSHPVDKKIYDKFLSDPRPLFE